MGTTNYNFTYMLDSSNIDIVGDVNDRLDEIDGAVKNAIDNIPTFDPTQIEQDIDDLEADVLALQNAGFVVAPVTTSDIQAGAVTYDKLAANSMKQALAGLRVYHFDSANPNADNTGMVVPYTGNDDIRDKSWLAGYYIPAWTMLIITHFVKGASYHCGTFFSGSTGWRLPSYVPAISAAYKPYPNDPNDGNLAGIAQIGNISKFDGGTTLDDIIGIGLNADGTIGVSTEYDSDALYSAGTIVACLNAYGAIDNSQDGYNYWI